MLSPLPLVHDFPHSLDDLQKMSRSGYIQNRFHVRCVGYHPFNCGGVSVCNILLECYLPDLQAFILHSVTRFHRTRVISTLRESATLCTLPVSGSPYRVGFMMLTATFSTIAGGLPWVRRITSPYPVQLHFGLVLRISGLAHPRLLDLLPAAI